MPKGVVVEHASVGAYVVRGRGVYGDVAVAGVSLLHSSVAFDLTVTGLWTPLVCGWVGVGWVRWVRRLRGLVRRSRR
ncbi:hypothetical protein SBADM41S_09420 [Streptomyces badius]